MPKASSFSPLQIVTPVQLVFCIILFFLPWVEVQCVLPPDKIKEAPKEILDTYKKELGLDFTKPISFISQSGFQIAINDGSPGSDMKKVEEKLKDKGGGKKPGPGPAPGPGPDLGGDDMFFKKKDKDKDEFGGTAPLLFLYPIALIGGIVMSFIPIPAMIRRIIVAGCCGGAFGVVALQCLIGFPIESDLKKKNDELKQSMNMMGKMGAPPGKGDAKDKKGETKSSDPDILRTSYQFSLYVTFLLLITAGGTAFLDALAGGGKPSKYGKKKRGRDYDDDDDEDDDEDYKPAKSKKKRDDDDDDEDDRPRKKKRRDDDDDDEDDRPRKKKASRDDDDEDEDDRPAKKPKPAPASPFEVVSPPAAPKPAAPGPPKSTGTAPKPAMPPAAAPKPAASRPASPPPPAAPAANPFEFDDDEPKAKKKRPRDDDDDYDDRPRKKRPRDDDDDDDDRPRKKRRRDDDD